MSPPLFLGDRWQIYDKKSYTEIKSYRNILITSTLYIGWMDLGDNRKWPQYRFVLL